MLPWQQTRRKNDENLDLPHKFQTSIRACEYSLPEREFHSETFWDLVEVCPPEIWIIRISWQWTIQILRRAGTDNIKYTSDDQASSRQWWWCRIPHPCILQWPAYLPSEDHCIREMHWSQDNTCLNRFSPMQNSGSLSQSVLHRNRSHESQPIGGVRLRPLSSPVMHPS